MTAFTSAYAHAYQATCLTRHIPAVPCQNFRLPKIKARYPYLPNDRSTTRARSNDFRGWAVYTDGGTRVVDGETLAGWGVISRSPQGKIDIMFDPVVTTEVHGPVARDGQSCIYCDSKHAAGVCLGTIQARTHVQLALACQQSMICAQHRLRLTMQHVYGHGGNLVNACADHAAALGTFGLTSSRNVVSRWIRNNVDASVCFDGCNNITKVLERLQHIRTDATSPPQNGSLCCVHHRVHCVSCASHAHFLSSVILLPAFFLRTCTLFFRTSNGKPFFVCLYRVELWRLLRA